VFDLLDKPKESKIVDIPCGAGAFVLRLFDGGYENVIAIDIDDILEIDHDCFVVGDMTERLPLEENTIDVLVCIDGIEHISRQFDFVKEVHRVLKDGGDFVVSTPNISSLRSRWKWFATGHHHKCISPLDENNPKSMHHIGMLSYPEMRYLLHSNGFTIQQVVTNRIKAINWLYALTIPFVFLQTTWVYYKSGKKDGTSTINSEIKKTIFSLPVLFGETIIVKATKNIS